jgi:hypothetical protein
LAVGGTLLYIHDATADGETKMATMGGFSWRGVAIRILVSFLIVFLTYNPTGYSYLHWLAGAGGGPLALKIAAGIFLLILLYLFFSVTYGVFRLSGLLAGAVAAALLSSQAVSFGLSWHRYETIGDWLLWVIYVALATLAIVIGFGLSWGGLIRQLSGQEYKRYVRRAG